MGVLKTFMCFLLLSASLQLGLSATVIYHHHPVYPIYRHPLQEQHPGYTIVAPLTKIAHVTYDSVPISHTPFEHVPLFQRIGHVKNVRRWPEGGS
ncbi:uncharacterized protein [Drosophila pseudoobscura]|uniref:Uncharacterized protein n=1 Tax=Drosophila pseudoobscura pseudoobscura TaxID=46245 RepID=A0A6I8V158_DROPS|nr:uncharacterized protein LOC6900013 [Drosophila pseudoobscura]